MKGFLDHFIMLSVFVVTAMSCTHSPKAHIAPLQYADSLMESHPDRVLSYLRSLVISDFSKADKMYYNLLLTQATDKNNLSLLPCDSLINEALDYYDKGDKVNRAKALLYKERIQQQMKMPKEAMENCFAGLALLGNTPAEFKLKGILYEDLGRIYQDQYLDEKALEMYQLSYQCDSLLNDDKLLIYSLSNLGWTSVVLNDKKSADKYLKRALKLAFNLKDSAFISKTYCKLSNNSVDIDSAFYYSRLACRYQTFKSPGYAPVCLGELMLANGQLDSAEYYLKRALSTANLDREVLIYRLFSELESKKGNYQSAYKYSLFYQEHVDSILSLNRASEIEHLAYKYEAELKVIAGKAKTAKNIQIAVFISIALLVTVILIILCNYRRKKILKLLYEQKIAHLNDQISLQQVNIERSQEDLIRLRQAQEQNNEEIAAREEEIHNMIEEKARLRNWIFIQTPIYKRIALLEKQKNNCKNEVQVLLQSEQELLKKTLFQIYDEYVQYLKSTYPKLTDDDCIYCCLHLCDLDDPTIAYCFGNTNKQIVAQRRLRLKTKFLVNS